MLQSKSPEKNGPEYLLQVKNLRVVFFPRRGPPMTALNGISLDVVAGEMSGILGESGSGKTTLGLALLGLLPETAEVTGAVHYRDCDLLASKERQLNRIRGAGISMVFQEPALALHPGLPVGDQIADVIRAHSACSRRLCREKAKHALAQVCLKDLRRIYSAYPHQLSGGQRQRVCIAQAVASQPSVLIADEPTASLDSTAQAEILTLLQDLNQRLKLAVLLISHNPAVLARLTDRVLVISSGRVVEEGPPDKVLGGPVGDNNPMRVPLYRGSLDLGN
jgi:ABC-type glutathione transport system ATPase component